MPWHIYAGAASRANFSIAIRHQIWGAKYDFFSELSAGDSLFFHHAISSDRSPAPSGFPKFCTPDEFSGTIQSVFEVELTSNPYEDHSVVWPDDTYPYRFDFIVKGKEEKVVLTESTVSDQTRLAIHFH